MFWRGCFFGLIGSYVGLLIAAYIFVVSGIELCDTRIGQGRFTCGVMTIAAILMWLRSGRRLSNSTELFMISIFALGVPLFLWTEGVNTLLDAIGDPFLSRWRYLLYWQLMAACGTVGVGGGILAHVYRLQPEAEPQHQPIVTTDPQGSL